MKVSFTQVGFKSHMFATLANPKGFSDLTNTNKLVILRGLNARGLCGSSGVTPELLRTLCRPHATAYRREDNKGFTCHHFEVIAL